MAALDVRGAVAAPGKPRKGDGRFATERNPVVLFEIVCEVAHVAARRDPDPLKDPASVSQAAWNAARRLAPEYGAIPQANEVCRQLCDRDGKPWPWRELLAVVLDPSRDPKKTWEERLSEPDRPISEAHVRFALNYVALRLEENAPLRSVHQYEETRERLLRECRAAGGPVEALRQRLPTRGQIESLCAGNWTRALELAGLLEASAHEGEAAVPIVEALLHFYAAEGYLPTELELAEAARNEGFRFEPARGRWYFQIEEAEREAQRRGLPKPPPYGTRPRERHRDGDEAAGRPHTKGIYSRVQVLEGVREFVASLPASTSPTDKQWREFKRGRPGMPSLAVIQRHGGLRLLLREASQPDWRERGEEWDRAAVPIPRSRLGRRKKDTGEKIEAAIRERGEASTRELAEALGLDVHVIRYFVRQLKDAGRIVTTQAYAQAKNQRYRPRDASGNVPT